MLEERNRVKKEKDKEEIRVLDKEDYLQDEILSRRRRSNKRKRENEGVSI